MAMTRSEQRTPRTRCSCCSAVESWAGFPTTPSSTHRAPATDALGVNGAAPPRPDPDHLRLVVVRGREHHNGRESLQERRERDGPKKVHSVSHEDGAHGDEQVACVATALRLVGEVGRRRSGAPRPAPVRGRWRWGRSVADWRTEGGPSVATTNAGRKKRVRAQAIWCPRASEGRRAQARASGGFSASRQARGHRLDPIAEGVLGGEGGGRNGVGGRQPW